MNNPQPIQDNRGDCPRAKREGLSPNSNPQQIHEDEIDLREYINVLIKRKKLILGIFIISIIASAVISLLVPKIYETSSIIQLGAINEFIISKEEAKEIILSSDNLLSTANELGLGAKPEALKRSIKIDDVPSTNLLRITIKGPDADKALKMHSLIVKPLIAQSQEIYSKRLSLIQDRLKELDQEIGDSSSDIARTKSLINGLPQAKGISHEEVSLRIILLQNTLPNYEMNLNVLRNQRNALLSSIAEAKDFKFFSQPIKQDVPIAPKKKQIVLVAGLIGLILGVLLSFILEFLQASKKELK